MLRLGQWPTRARAAALRRLRTVRASTLAVIGAPNYERYCEHVRRAHPDGRVLTRDEFFCRQLEHRYSRPGARCC
jgi:uncharacterized short protein YbdD (DUF466 family)